MVKAVPIYQDTVQPAAKQVGQSLELVSKTVNIALAPIKALVWGYEQIEGFIVNRVSEKLRNVPQQNIVTPSPLIAGPAIEALRYTGHEESLRELYANLLATAMDKETVSKAHPGYVDIIKNITPDEATLLQIFIKETSIPLIDLISKSSEDEGGSYVIIKSNFSHISKLISLTNAEFVPSYLDNLCRLGILEIPAQVFLSAPNIYESLKNDPELDSLKELIFDTWKKEVDYERKFVRLTSFGVHFVKNIVKGK